MDYAVAIRSSIIKRGGIGLGGLGGSLNLRIIMIG